MEPDFDDVFKCPLFSELKKILNTVEKPETGLIGTIDKIGKALREDYNEEYINGS